MKKLLLTFAAFTALTFAGIAQNQKAAQPAQSRLTPEQRADKQTSKATANLNLSDAQKTTFKKLTLERINQNQPLRQKMKDAKTNEEKTAIQNQIKANNEKFFTSVNSMLTPDQQTKWADHRKKMEANHQGPEHHD